MTTEGKFLFDCPEPNCYYRLLLPHGHDTTHKCPHIGPTQFGGSITLTILESMWKMLDEAIDALAEDKADPARAARARALCDALALWMPPHFRTSDEIAAEAKRRRKARIEGDDKYETKGLGSLRYLAPEKWVKAVDGGATSNPEYAAEQVGHGFTDEEVVKLKTFHENGFSAQDLAGVHNVSLKVMLAALRS